jgi:hypothetical protein
MKYLRLIAALFVGLLVISLLTEAIEFLLVRLVAGQPFDYLRNNPDEYFAVRNRTWILVAKMGYSFLAAAVGGYLTARISGAKARPAVIALIGIQAAALLWAAFFSELAATGPRWMWLVLVVVIPAGIWQGYRRAA